jgi:FkbM family methyltransferase
MMRAVKANISAALQGVSRKAQVAARGHSPVPKSCQIPNVRRLYQALGLSATDGVFAEIGGFDGETFSNTSFLADQGWRGLYVEPIQQLCTSIRARHFLNRVTVECAAIGAAAGSTPLHVMGALSTSSNETKEAYAAIDWARGATMAARSIVVPTRTLGDVLSRHRIPEKFDLMVIDVEGGEEAVVRDLLASPWRPNVLIAELNDIHPDFTPFPGLQASAAATRRMILDDRYRQYFADMINTVFVLADER